MVRLLVEGGVTGRSRSLQNLVIKLAAAERSTIRKSSRHSSNGSLRELYLSPTVTLCTSSTSHQVLLRCTVFIAPAKHNAAIIGLLVAQSFMLLHHSPRVITVLVVPRSIRLL